MEGFLGNRYKKTERGRGGEKEKNSFSLLFSPFLYRLSLSLSLSLSSTKEKTKKNYSKLPDDRLGEVARARRTPQISSPPLPFRDHPQRRVLDPLRRGPVPDVPQHHHPGEHQRRRVGLVLSGDVGGRAVHGLHQRQPLRSDVAGRGEPEPSDEAGAEVGNDVPVQVGHDLFGV